MDFAKALARQLDVAVDDLGINDAAIAPAHGHGKEPKSRKRPLAMASAILIALLIAGAGAAFILAGRHQNEAVHQQPPVPAVPVVLVGADCEVLGAAGVTETGQKAYCARLPSTGGIMWSLVSGVVPTPTITPGPKDPVYPAGIEQQVRVCIQETGQTRLQCREDIRRGNLYGPP
jgi:serine/threonine-protein kinase